LGRLPPLASYRSRKRQLVQQFGLTPLGIELSGQDAVSQGFFKGFKQVSIEWDVWSGFIVVAKNKRAEPLVLQISSYLNDPGAI